MSKLKLPLGVFTEYKTKSYISLTSFLITITLFNGFLLYFTIFRDYVLSDTLRALLIDIALLSPVLFFPKKVAKVYLFLVLFLVVLSSLINVLHIVLYKNFISFWAIQVLFETTNSEAGEFVRDFFDFKLLLAWFASIFIPISVFKLVKKKSLKVARSKVFPCVIIFYSLIILFVFFSKGEKFYNSHYMCLNVWSINKYLGEEKIVESASVQKIESDLGQLEQKLDRINLVVIVGEAANRNHMGCYGYKRQTTPKLDSLLKNDKSLLKFNNVISSATHTVPSLKNGLMFANTEFSQPYVSIVDALNSCGFKTYHPTICCG